MSRIATRFSKNVKTQDVRTVTAKLYSQSSAVKMASNIYGAPTDAPPLIIMHGLFGSKQNWRGICRALEKNLSPQRRPHLVDRAIIVDISPVDMPRNIDHMENMFKAMGNIKVPPEASMAQGRAIAEKQIKDELDEHQSTIDFIMQNLQKSKTGEFKWAINVEALRRNFSNMVSFRDGLQSNKFNGPTMFIAGEDSSFVNPNDWPAIQEIFPNSEIQWLQAGHLVHLDQPLQFIKLVVEFLR